MKMSTEQFRDFVGSTIFTVRFIKADGTERVMTARLGVAVDLKGTRPEANAKRLETLQASNKVGVYEVPTGQYRTINLDTMLELKARGEVLTF